ERALPPRRGDRAERETAETPHHRSPMHIFLLFMSPFRRRLAAPGLPRGPGRFLAGNAATSLPSRLPASAATLAGALDRASPPWAGRIGRGLARGDVDDELGARGHWPSWGR